MFEDTDIKQAVRERYAEHATKATSCCGPGAASNSCATDTKLLAIGYDEADLAEIPDGADLGLGCGNPLAMLDLAEGETVLDLGSGGGVDCFLAAKRVGPTGRVIGVDMTPEMLARARRNAAEGGYKNVEFRLGEIEHLPVADASVDAIISNCVVNLVPDKAQVFADMARVLKPGGRVSVSDIVLVGEIPLQIRDSVEAYVGCLAGAIQRDDYIRMLQEAGLADVRITEERSFTLEDVADEPVVADVVKRTGAGEAELRDAASRFRSIKVQARKV